MERNLNVYEQAFGYHKSGFHCAEAASKAIIEAYGNGTGNDIPKVATAFGGGVGPADRTVRMKLKNFRHNRWLFLHRLI